MRKVGLIGGTSWHSTVAYYATINQRINEHHADNTNPPLHLVSLNQKQIHDLQRADDWGAIADIFVRAARELQDCGVEGIALCANTPHKVVDQMSQALSVPILHIADAIGATLAAVGVDAVGLIGTRFTMEQDFIKGRLRDRYQVTTRVPPVSEQHHIQALIYNELSIGVFKDDTQDFFLKVIDSLSARGAQAVILGCTEFPLLLKEAHCPLLLIDSLQCHCEAIVRYILGQENPAQALMAVR